MSEERLPGNRWKAMLVANVKIGSTKRTRRLVDWRDFAMCYLGARIGFRSEYRFTDGRVHPHDRHPRQARCLGQ